MRCLPRHGTAPLACALGASAPYVNTLIGSGFSGKFRSARLGKVASVPAKNAGLYKRIALRTAAATHRNTALLS